MARSRLKLGPVRRAAILGGLCLIVAAVFVLPGWHFEDRHGHNATPAGLAELKGPTWTELSKELSIYHDDGVGASERKFIRGDESSFLGLGGHEAVWNPDTNALIEEGPFRATYNYVNPGGFFRDIGHGIFDVVPYWFGGTERGDEGTTFFKRVTAEEFEDVPTVVKVAIAVSGVGVAALFARLLFRARLQRRKDNPQAATTP